MSEPTFPRAQEMFLPDGHTVDDALSQRLRDYYERLLAQREEILAAFVAKYGCQPDEIVQELQRNETYELWSVRLRRRKPGDADARTATQITHADLTVPLVAFSVEDMPDESEEDEEQPPEADPSPAPRDSFLCACPNKEQQRSQSHEAPPIPAEAFDDPWEMMSEAIQNGPVGPRYPTSEADPSGRNQHEPGAKLDAGKNRCGLVIHGFAGAIEEVSRIGTFGAAKYTPDGWRAVPNGHERYTDALYRHLLKEAQGEELDPDSGLLHAAHAAWNALARLQLQLDAAAANAPKE